MRMTSLLITYAKIKVCSIVRQEKPEKDRTRPVLKLFWSPPDGRTGPGQTSKAHGVTRWIFFGRPENPKSTLFCYYSSLWAIFMQSVEASENVHFLTL